MTQHYRKTLLIVCEGTRSEPDYFHNLKNEVIIANGNEIYIKILPIPPQEQEQIEEDARNFQLRPGARRRILNKSTNPIQEFSIEDEFKAQPTCYIRKAQLAYLESGYDELWAVYDLDGHPNHKEAVDLALPSSKCAKQVNIGFSAVSFEIWLLLHFEVTANAFQSSQCRDSQKQIYHCGTNVHLEDCKGNKCVVGKIVTSQYLADPDGKVFEYAAYGSLYTTALQNAILLRENSNLALPIYAINPYTSVDKLVFKLKFFHKAVGSSRVDLQACKLEYSIVSPK